MPLLRYGWLRQRFDRYEDQFDAQWRARPHGLNSIAWLVWHVARCEDGGLNRLVIDRLPGDARSGGALDGADACALTAPRHDDDCGRGRRVDRERGNPCTASRGALPT
jgi:hypothetical protein